TSVAAELQPLAEIAMPFGRRRVDQREDGGPGPARQRGLREGDRRDVAGGDLPSAVKDALHREVHRRDAGDEVLGVDAARIEELHHGTRRTETEPEVVGTAGDRVDG